MERRSAAPATTQVEAALALGSSWALETAALLSPLGAISLPTDLQRCIHEGETLRAEDLRILACGPQLTDRLLAPVPRLEEVRSLILSRLRLGMVVAEAVYTSAGQLLVNRGFEVSENFLARVAHFRRGQIREPVQVILPRMDAKPA